MIIIAQQIGYRERFKEARKEFYVIWQLRKKLKHLGENHLSTLNARFSHAQMNVYLGKSAKAEKECRSILAIQKRPNYLNWVLDVNVCY